MESFIPLLVLVVIWLCIGLPLVKMSQAAKKNAQKKAGPGPEAFPSQKGTAPETAVEGPSESSAARSVMRPTISLTPHDDSIYMGSLNAVTGEGWDPCHEEQLHPLTAAESRVPAPAPSAPGLQLSWTGNDIVRGFVMGEILKRK